MQRARKPSVNKALQLINSQSCENSVGPDDKKLMDKRGLTHERVHALKLLKLDNLKDN